MPLVYCATSASLAVLETFVHIPPPQRKAGVLPNMVLVELEVASAGIVELTRDLSLDPPERLALVAKWIEDARYVGALVRSHVVPADQNLLLNPQHPDFSQTVTLIRQDPFEYDPRMLP